MSLTESSPLDFINDETFSKSTDQSSSLGLTLKETSTILIQHASNSSEFTFYHKNWFNNTIGAIVLNYFLMFKTLLFRHDVVLENGDKLTSSCHPVKVRGMCTWNYKIIYENEDITNNEHICNAIMNHVREDINRPAGLLTGMLAFLSSDNSE